MWQLNRPHPSSCMYTLISNLSKYNLPIFCSQGVEVLHVAGEQAPSIISCMLYPQGVQILHVAYHLVYYIHRVFRYYMWQLNRLNPDNQLVKALTCIGRMSSFTVECVFICAILPHKHTHTHWHTHTRRVLPCLPRKVHEFFFP